MSKTESLKKLYDLKNKIPSVYSQEDEKISILIGLLNDVVSIISKIEVKPELNPTFVVPDVKIPPINIPEIKVPNVYVPESKITVNPAQVSIDLQGVIDALENIKYISDNPKKPISVRMSDGSKFVEAIQQLKDSTEQLGVVYAGSSGISKDEFKSTIRDAEDFLAGYQITDKDDDASPNYYGFTDKIGSWYILKETVSAGADTYRYVSGSSGYTTNWTNRASLTYDYFYGAF